MDLIYILSGLCTVGGAIAGLVLTCYLEKRSFTSRKRRTSKLGVAQLPADGLST